MPRVQTRNGQPAIYNVTPPTLLDGEAAALQVDSSGNLKVSGIVTGGDIEIGAVEIKNGVDDTRLNVATDDSAMPATPTIIPTGGEYRASATTYTDGDATVDQSDINGNKKITLATAIAGEDLTNDLLKVEQRFSYAQIAAGQATTVVKAGAGFLHSITFNGPATATNTTTVYDNASGSGTVIAIPLATAVVMPITVIYDVSFALGLTIITATANGANMTVSYR